MARMCHRRLARASLAIALWTAFVAWGDPGIAVIVSRDAGPALRLDQVTLRNVYLKKVVVDNRGEALVPVNLPADHPLRHAFSRRLLGWSEEAVQDYWNERYFHGVRPPYVLSSPRAVIRFVASTPGAIGYVADCELEEGVVEVMHLVARPEERAALSRLCAESQAGPGRTADRGLR